jgi:hypothetical protein
MDNPALQYNIIQGDTHVHYELKPVKGINLVLSRTEEYQGNLVKKEVFELKRINEQDILYPLFDNENKVDGKQFNTFCEAMQQHSNLRGYFSSHEILGAYKITEPNQGTKEIRFAENEYGRKNQQVTRRRSSYAHDESGVSSNSETILKQDGGSHTFQVVSIEHKDEERNPTTYEYAVDIHPRSHDKHAHFKNGDELGTIKVGGKTTSVHVGDYTPIGDAEETRHVDEQSLHNWQRSRLESYEDASTKLHQAALVEAEKLIKEHPNKKRDINSALAALPPRIHKAKVKHINGLLELTKKANNPAYPELDLRPLQETEVTYDATPNKSRHLGNRFVNPYKGMDDGEISDKIAATKAHIDSVTGLAPTSHVKESLIEGRINAHRDLGRA